MYKKYMEDEALIEKLENLNEKKYKLKKMIDESNINEPFVVELAGAPRTGKTECLEKILEFFLKAKFKVQKTNEPAQILKEKFDTSKFSNLDFNDKTLEISKEELNECKKEKPHIILQDRGVIDNYIWYQMMYEKNEISLETYLNKMSTLDEDLKELDQLYLMTANPEEIVRRDYINQIYLEKRKKTTVENIIRLEEGMNNLTKRINNNNLYKLDTTNLTLVDTSIYISDNIINDMTKKLKRNSNFQDKIDFK